jgi:hypothetical protein
LKLKGISTNSQVSSTFYSIKTQPPTHKDDEGDFTSPSALDFNGPLPPPHQCNVIHAATKDFFSHKLIRQHYKKKFLKKKNKDLWHAYLARFSERKRDLIKVQWIEKNN